MNDDTMESKYQDPSNKNTRQFFLRKNPHFRVNVAGDTHVGLRRARNEDHYAVMRRIRSSELVLSNLPQATSRFDSDEAFGLVVADGIGGARFGDIASQLALETVLEASELATSWLMKFRNFDAQQVEARTAAYIDRIQEKFKDYGFANPAAQEMGTTLTSAYLIPPHAIIMQIGDSRAYLFRDGQLKQLTRDQTLAQLLMDQGVEPDHAKKFGHVLLNSLGCSSEKVDSEILHLELKNQDRILLCSDGLTDMVPDSEIAETMAGPSLDEVCQRLIQLALEHGGRDNVTVVLAEILDPAD